MNFHDFVGWSAQILEATGVAVIAAGSLGAAAVAIGAGWKAGDLSMRYKEIRQRVGRAILLGLEILVGSDIIRTVAEQPTLESVSVLAGIVLIRTFLSFTLEVELEGHWPWQKVA